MSGEERKPSYLSVGLSVGGDWRVTCHTYPDRGPILAVDAAGMSLVVSAKQSTPDANHLDFAYALLAAVNDYLIACETHRFDAEEAANASTDVTETAAAVENRAA
ncbi:hypothetical protein FF36_00011 [Frankia torreyi]|uniref:Uncharacterized protein n=1 Tax=Frankia torreyi TaxID=1856 RepID=A0A0D8BN08_9ACTN|nr:MULTISPECIES: hypothetical protein [Frankia]KJE25399.1 hypothetical protein FF36_00011 [Frankia torreyi]KQM04757.1 hypothetical protein FF86_102211 [Frankia sp. CpI1-P]